MTPDYDGIKSIKKRINKFPAIARFKKKIKKINEIDLLKKILGALECIMDDPLIGDKKIGGKLDGIRTVKIKDNGIDYRLAYVVYIDEGRNILFIYFDSRENVYTELKNIIDSNASIRSIIRKGI